MSETPQTTADNGGVGRARRHAGRNVPCPTREVTRFPVELTRQGPALLNQQCWCWGWDIRRSEGNLLLARGFERKRVPEGEQGSSAYTLRLDDGYTVVLWGFGIFYGGEEFGVFLPRAGFRPALASSTLATACWWRLDQVEARRPARDVEAWRGMHRLLAGAMRWIAAYERWVSTTFGPDYRRQCVGAWQKNTIPADDMADGWEALAALCDGRAGKSGDGVAGAATARALPGT
jgi:hypothetical protein